MAIGPAVALLVYVADKEITIVEMNPLYLIPGYVGLYLSLPFLAVFAYSFVQPEISDRHESSFNTQIVLRPSNDILDDSNSSGQMQELDHYQKRLKEIHAERYSFWTVYGPFCFILAVRLFEKYCHEGLIVTLPVIIGSKENSVVPFVG